MLVQTVRLFFFVCFVLNDTPISPSVQRNIPVQCIYGLFTSLSFLCQFLCLLHRNSLCIKHQNIFLFYLPKMLESAHVNSGKHLSFEIVK